MKKRHPTPDTRPSPPCPNHSTYLKLQKLTYRTFNRDFGLPNCNDDHLACLLRDELMPERGRMHRERDPGLWYRARIMDLRYLGVPGERAAWGGGGRAGVGGDSWWQRRVG